MKSRNTIRDAVRFALTAGVAASVAQAPAAFGADDDAARLDRVEVTGTRIKRLDIEGPSPVTVISREDIEASGDLSVADVLRDSTFNSFGSFAESSGYTAQSQATVSLRGCGSNRSLVLLDGRRVAGSGVIDGGQTQNLNIIPLAAVERIEVLQDGASAIYGTDAICGVVNVILRKDYEGINMGVGYAESSWGEPTESSAHIVGGMSGGSGNITFTLDHQERGMFFDADRPWSQTGLSVFGYPPSMASWDPDTSLTVINPSVTTTITSAFADPRCPASLGAATDGLGNPNTFPNSINTLFGFCQYNYASQAATQASLKRDSLMLNSSYEINQNMTFFTRVTVSHTESFGRYAPAPNTFFPTMGAANPNNYTNTALHTTTSTNQADIDYANYLAGLFANSQYSNPNQAAICSNTSLTCPYTANGAYNGPFNLTLYIRMVPNGPRDSNTTDRLMDILVGVEGYSDWFGGADWEVAYAHSRATMDAIGAGYGINSLLQAAIDGGSYSPFVPIDPQGSGGLGDTLPFAHTIINHAETVRKTLDADISFDLFEMSNGPVSFLVGSEYTEESFTNDNDAQSVAGNVFGTAGGNSAGKRHYYSVFSEMVLPVLDTVEVDLALRYDDYQGFGDTVNPKIAVSWRPMDNLLFRASYGTGFRAPDLFILNQLPQQSFPGAIDTTNCDTGDVFSCTSRQYEVLFLANPALGPEESTNWSAGVVWNATDSLTLGLQYYNIKLDNQISSVTLGQMLVLEDLGLVPTELNTRTGTDDTDPTARVVRDPVSNRITLVVAPSLNLSGFKTSGWDFSLDYGFGVGDIGEFDLAVRYTLVNEFLTEFLPGSGFIENLGFGLPDARATVGLNWALGDFGANFSMNHIGSSTSITVGGPVTLDSYTTFDLQFTYETSWDGKFTIGARNLFAEDPPVDATGSIGHPNWSRFLHDALGRMTYVRYEQNL